MRPTFLAACILAGAQLCLIPLAATTLERLSLDEMIEKSTAIVRGRVGGCGAQFRGRIVYTFCSVQVLERLKGPEASLVSVATPGGNAGGVKQTFSGTPVLTQGTEHVFFLWTGRTGITQIIGLSQGLLQIKQSANGEMMVTRQASTETMLDPMTGRPVADAPVSMTLSDLRARIGRKLGSQ